MRSFDSFISPSSAEELRSVYLLVPVQSRHNCSPAFTLTKKEVTTALPCPDDDDEDTEYEAITDYTPAAASYFCTIDNAGSDICVRYSGADWTAETAQTNCEVDQADIIGTQGSAHYEADQDCELNDNTLGVCFIDRGLPTEQQHEWPKESSGVAPGLCIGFWGGRMGFRRITVPGLLEPSAEEM